MFAKHLHRLKHSLKALRLRDMCAGLILLAIFSASPALANTLTVTNLMDSGVGSHRAAIASGASSDTFNFSVTGTFILPSLVTTTTT